MAQWYAHVNGQQFGPVDQEQMQAWVREGRVTGETSVWCDGMDDWKPAREVPELAPAIGPGAAGPSPFNAPPARGTTFANAAYTPAGQPKRPGGLTAMAVLNFIFGGLGVIGIVSTPIMLLTMPNNPGLSYTASPLWWLSFLLGSAGSVVEVVAGVGYLKLRRGMGLIGGNVYAVLSLAGLTAGVLMQLTFRFPGPAGMADMISITSVIGSLLGAIYPVVTLILLNKVFAKHFVN